MVTIQVTTLSKINPFPLGASLDRIMGDSWVIVNSGGKQPRTYIPLPREVKELPHRGTKHGRVSYWLQRSAHCIADFHEGWERIRKPDQIAQKAAAVHGVAAAEPERWARILASIGTLEMKKLFSISSSLSLPFVQMTPFHV